MNDDIDKKMTPKNIDSNGFWHVKGAKVNLLENLIPIPESLIINGNELEEVLLLVQANDYIYECHSCKSIVGDEMIILVLETVRLFPAQCCNMMQWYIEDKMSLDKRCNHRQ